MKDLVIALIVSALGGIAYLAYRHPKSYDKMFLRLFLGWTALYLAISIWSASAEYTFLALKPFIEYGKVDEARKVVEESVQPIEWWTMVGFYVAGWIYLFVLWRLPEWLKHDENERTEEKH